MPLRSRKSDTRARHAAAPELGVPTADELAAAVPPQSTNGTTPSTGKRGGKSGAPASSVPRPAPDADALALVSETIARDGLFVPLRIVDSNTLEVAVSEPSEALHHYLSRVTGKNIALYVAPRSSVLHALNRSYLALADVGNLVTAFEKTERARPGAQVTETAVTQDSPVVQIVNKTIMQALRDRASDI